MRDIYFDYENGVLINKLGIKNAEVLKQAEADLTIVRLKEILDSPDFEYSKDYYLALHRKMFGDLYSFAGELRKIDIEKTERVLSGGTMLFTHYREVDRKLREVFLKRRVDFSSDTDITAVNLRNFMTGVWEVHPFREGNTRSIITFAMKYAKSNNMPFDEGLLLESFSYIRDALVMSVYKTPMYLDKILVDAIERGKKL